MIWSISHQLVTSEKKTMTSAILVNVVHLPDTLGACVEVEEEGDVFCFQGTESEVVIGLK